MRVVRLPRHDDVMEEVSKFGGEGIGRCIQCGACMSVCPVAIAGFNFPNKKLFKVITLGLREDILFDPSPWACVACGRCIEICTRDVNPFHVYFAFRRIQTREFSIPSRAEELLRRVYTTGFAVQINNELRAEFDLPEIGSVDEVEKIIECTEMSQLGLIR
ncbi:MAG: Heterodisulfide reductase, subunit C (HdrC) [Archaeoglobus fulgidus]|uniref:Heterodisulfide reductase, subunit C (HdrC) n=1 Tax=Archaeoglobus fulgidus TaxID=2234 RepID=A0A101DCS6_ARCFL|nr:4Fe-4S dicluster domain-containing protein [Archaeoglobus fulgidus]KUJ93183.1 MAG: Heterodisulfide reductase, subunit C (HdrC) [Archaeoglobus fulgidus]KUK05718.1 MAG: Heterodisulfide reductase, subunit C (HdrC) [Archaeoglobus fulgidus]